MYFGTNLAGLMVNARNNKEGSNSSNVQNRRTLRASKMLPTA